MNTYPFAEDATGSLDRGAVPVYVFDVVGTGMAEVAGVGVWGGGPGGGGVGEAATHIGG